MSAIGLLLAGGSGDDLRGHGAHCPFRLKTARGGAADVGFAMWFRTSGQGGVQAYLANSAVSSRPEGRTLEDPGTSARLTPGGWSGQPHGAGAVGQRPLELQAGAPV